MTARAHAHQSSATAAVCVLARQCCAERSHTLPPRGARVVQLKTGHNTELLAASELIGTADGINHAIPTRDELAASLGALQAAGLVEHTEGRLRTTPQGKTLKKHWQGGLFDWSKSLLPHLEKLPRPTGELAITESEVQTAYVEYVRRQH
jgi:hypothetical protein